MICRMDFEMFFGIEFLALHDGRFSKRSALSVSFIGGYRVVRRSYATSGRTLLRHV